MALRFNKIFIILCLAFSASLVEAQVFNDSCESAFNIEDPVSYCSDAGEFTNVNSLPSTVPAGGCWPFAIDNIDNDVWFTFIAVANAASVVVNGATDGAISGGTLINPQMALYEGDCNTLNEIGCIADFDNTNVVEFIIPDLIVGARYYLRVEADDDFVGSFELCVNAFNSVPEPEADCPSSVILCDKSSFVVEQLIGGGVIDQLPESACNREGCDWEESNSSWYTWTVDDPGTLAFTLTPLREDDDLDFALYELPNGLGDCSELIELRCMLSGLTGGDVVLSAPCIGATGLSLAESDFGESCGCDPGDNNFISGVNVEAGKVYGLLVNNFSESGNGFNIDFSGSATFLGPVADFVLSADTIECDRSITIEDFSSFDAGNIIRKTWSFGANAEPATAVGEGPFEVFYPAIGDQFIVLTVETDEGCIVTEIKNLHILSCCEIDSDIGVSLVNIEDPNCSDSTDGIISVAGSGGDPEYSFSINEGPFVGSPNFFNLAIGVYDIGIIDIKGCETEIEAILEGPPPLIIDAGPDQTVDLGFEADINALLSPPGSIVDITWIPDTLLSCSDCLNFSLIPPGQTTYQVTVINEDGCTSMDSITIFVNDIKPIYIPNAFTPDGDGINDLTSIFGGPAAVQVEEMSIFDKWGNEVWRGQDIPLNDFNVGWNGIFRGKPMNQGVFVYQAAVSFIDGEVLIFKGDITLLR